ncbi:chaplin family protein [Streptomyces endophyticus]|uniref:chaplin family protein n=1 Tax=Streptomyces endophyticus TaxID=714166 RepID=UPI002DBD460A|nr:chaplin family protein [Streptomyces endophyticus]
MRQVMRKGLITVAAASGVLAVTGGYAHADSSANGSSSDSPGVLSGNSVEAPVDVPVNACGNTINVVGLLNPASGNDCGGSGGGDKAGDQSSDGGAQAGGHSSDSPGVGSGNHVSVPVNVPVNACGNSVGAGSIGNGTTGNGCSDDGGGGSTTTPPADSNTPPSRAGHPGVGTGADTPNDPGTQTVAMPQGESQLGQTGSPRATGTLAETGSSVPIGGVIPIAGGALLVGALLYRRANAAA